MYPNSFDTLSVCDYYDALVREVDLFTEAKLADANVNNIIDTYYTLPTSIVSGEPLGRRCRLQPSADRYFSARIAERLCQTATWIEQSATQAVENPVTESERPPRTLDADWYNQARQQIIDTLRGLQAKHLAARGRIADQIPILMFLGSRPHLLVLDAAVSWRAIPFLK